ncbi:beta-phosphoglucomutase [Paenibacillus sp. CN-4]|uniref:beta-phosphoglucomutase n=1 Tax=Paenibacillus nanchangensis TaxID=3348343 RepID=UPI00397B20FD
MSNTTRLQAVIFDLDGVITDTAEFHYRAWDAIAHELGLPFTREFNENLKGVSRMDSLKLLLGLGEPRNFTPAELEALATRKNELYVELIGTITPDDLLPGVREFLDDIRAAGIRTGIASASRNAFTVIDRLGVGSDFNVIVDAGKLKRNKPDPEVFLTAAEALGADPRFCMGVEDAAAGIQAIKAAGMFGVALGPEEGFPGADVVLPGTRELHFGRLLQQFEAWLGAPLNSSPSQ